MDAREGQMPANYPIEAIEHISLRDGTPVTIRPICPDDALKLQVGFLRLTPNSVYLRFLESIKQLPDQQAHDLSTVDYHRKMALVAETEEHGQLQGIGVARYALIDPPEAGIAECAIVVLDEYQGRGLGKHLMRSLILYARNHGVSTLRATVHATNQPILRFIQSYGLTFTRKVLEPGVLELQIHLPQDLAE